MRIEFELDLNDLRQVSAMQAFLGVLNPDRMPAAKDVYSRALTFAEKYGKTGTLAPPEKHEFSEMVNTPTSAEKSLEEPEKPTTKKRRTKAEIEADKKAEETESQETESQETESQETESQETESQETESQETQTPEAEDYLKIEEDRKALRALYGSVANIDNKSVLKAKLTELGANNISLLDHSKFAEFETVLRTFE